MSELKKFPNQWVYQPILICMNDSPKIQIFIFTIYLHLYKIHHNLLDLLSNNWFNYLQKIKMTSQIQFDSFQKKNNYLFLLIINGLFMDSIN